jgi:hypothetical protein
MDSNRKNTFKNSIQNLGEGAIIFSTFLQNEMAMYCMSPQIQSS